jgi:hypothetical protein
MPIGGLVFQQESQPGSRHQTMRNARRKTGRPRTFGVETYGASGANGAVRGCYFRHAAQIRHGPPEYLATAHAISLCRIGTTLAG